METGQCDDVEGSIPAWQAKGFARVGGSLPQRYRVQVIVFADGQVRVEQVTLDAANRGNLQLPAVSGRGSRLVLAVAGTTPVTTETARYQFSVQ
jgi:hypothetical protein